MKNKLIFIFAFLMCVSINAQETNNIQPPKKDSSATWKINLDFASAFGGVFNIGYERAFSKSHSFGLRAQIGNYIVGTAGSASNQEWTYLVGGYGLVPEFKYYPFNRRVQAPIGFFIGMHSRFRMITEKYREVMNNGGNIFVSDTIISNSAFVGDVGINGGFSIPFLPNISSDFLIGYGYTFGGFNNAVDRDKIDSFYRYDIDDWVYRVRIEISISVVFPQIRINKRKPKIKVIDGPYLEH